MVPGRPADGVGRRGAAQHEVRRGGRGVAGRLRARPGASADRGHRVHGVAAELGADGGRRAVGVAAVGLPRRRGTSTAVAYGRAGVVEVAVGHPAVVARWPAPTGTVRRGPPAARPARGRAASWIGAPAVRHASSRTWPRSGSSSLSMVTPHQTPVVTQWASEPGAHTTGIVSLHAATYAARRRTVTPARACVTIRRDIVRPTRDTSEPARRTAAARYSPADAAAHAPAPEPGTWASRSGSCRPGRATPSPTCRASWSARPPCGGTSPTRRRVGVSPARASPPSCPGGGPLGALRAPAPGRGGRAQRRRRAHLGGPGGRVGAAGDADPADVDDAGRPGVGLAGRAALRPRP